MEEDDIYLNQKKSLKESNSVHLDLEFGRCVGNEMLSIYENLDLIPDLETITHASEYMDLVKPHIVDNLITNSYMGRLKEVSDIFIENITSFLIFETHLNSKDKTVDYSFAVSSKNYERENLLQSLKNGKFMNTFLKKDEWVQLTSFVEAWTSDSSILNDNVRGLWFEFDAESCGQKLPIPSIFIQPASSYTITGDFYSQNAWIVNQALPLLLGEDLKKSKKEKILECIELLPLNAGLFQIGAMLSRTDQDIRIVIKGMDHFDIVPYLQSIGWKDNNKQSLSKIIEEIKNIVTRIVLHISVGKTVNPKVGIECSFKPDEYHQEEGWGEFLDFLKEKNLCNQQKCEALKKFSGIKTKVGEKFDFGRCIPAVLMSDQEYSNALVRYISHIKINYIPNGVNEVKAYPAVRLFGFSQESDEQLTKLVKNG